METRIYVVYLKNTNAPTPPRLVEATSVAQAIRYCAKHTWDAHAATPKDIAGIMSGGVTVEKANEANEQTTKQ